LIRVVAHHCAARNVEVACGLDRLFDCYYERVKQVALTADEEAVWIDLTARAIVDGGLAWATAEEAVAQVELRPGVRECWEELRADGHCIGIVSYSIAPFIRMLLKRHGVAHLVQEVLAQDISFDGLGRASGVVPGTSVTPSSKGTRSLEFAARCGVPMERLLAVGDSEGDRNLGGYRRNRLGLAETEAERIALEPFMGEAVLVADFQPVRAWLRRRMG
jgi:phosphoglycolate phosphatase-like HAD superfamily hydrolase